MEETSKSFLESKQNRATALRDLTVKTKRKPSKLHHASAGPRQTTSSRLAIGPSFIVRKHWRDTLTRLTEFLRLLDYLILELLRRLVKSAVRDLLMHLRQSYFVEFELNNGGEVEDGEDLQFHPKSLLKRSEAQLSSCSDRLHSLLLLSNLRPNPNDASDHQEKSTLKSDDLHREDLYPSKDALDLPHVCSRTTTHRNAHHAPFLRSNEADRCRRRCSKSPSRSRFLRCRESKHPNWTKNPEQNSKDTRVLPLMERRISPRTNPLETHDRVTYEITPSEYDFKNATRDIINGLETSVGNESFDLKIVACIRSCL